MTLIIIITLIVFVLLFVQVFLSNTKNKWSGLIIPILIFSLTTISFIYNINDSHESLSDFGKFLIENNGQGLITLILRAGFLYIPFLIAFGIYIFSRIKVSKKTGNKKGKNEIEKMMISDLS